MADTADPDERVMPGTRLPHMPGRVSQNDAPRGVPAVPSIAGRVSRP